MTDPVDLKVSASGDHAVGKSEHDEGESLAHTAEINDHLGHTTPAPDNGKTLCALSLLHAIKINCKKSTKVHRDKPMSYITPPAKEDRDSPSKLLNGKTSSTNMVLAFVKIIKDNGGTLATM